MRWPDEVESPERVRGERRGSGTRNDTETDRDENGQRDAGREAPMGALRSPAQGDGGRTTTRALERVQCRIDGDGLGAAWPQRKIAARSRAEIEYTSVSVGHEPAAPGRDSAPLVQRADDVVEPRDLLDTAHQPTFTTETMPPIMCIGLWQWKSQSPWL